MKPPLKFLDDRFVTENSVNSLIFLWLYPRPGFIVQFIVPGSCSDQEVRYSCGVPNLRGCTSLAPSFPVDSAC